MSQTNQRLKQPVESLSTRTLRRGLSFFGAICVCSTVGYVLAGWDWVDAIYMVTITIFGVGYGEVQPIESPLLKLFTIGVIFSGCTSLIYVIGGLVQMLAEGEIQQMLGKRQRSREVDTLSDHTIICGYGRVGKMLAAELVSQGEQLVVLDNNRDRVDKAIQDGYLAIEGNAVDDQTLHDAGLFRARTIATVLPDDAINVFITLTARDLSETIRIIARAESPSTERKLIRGGASHVVMPAAIGAIRIAQLAAAKEVASERLPEQRYRMLQRGLKQPAGLAADQQDEAVVQDEVERLAELASELTQSMDSRETRQTNKV